MTMISRIGDLEIAQNINFQRREWTVQRIGWAVMALIILAGLLGLLGPGPLSRTTKGDQNGPLFVEYNRFGRFQSPTTLRIQLGPEAVREGEARVSLNSTYLDRVQIQQVTPDPERVEVAPDHITYVFAVSNPSEPLAVHLHLQPNHFGPLRGRVALDGGQSLDLNQFVYP